MNLDKFYSDYSDSLIKAYSCLKEQLELNVNNLISPHTLELPTEILESAREAINALFKLRCDESYQSDIYKSEGLDFSQINNNAVLMGYDFHLDANNTLKLIEINTNSSGYLFVDQLYKFKNQKSYPNALESLKKSFFSESSNITNIAIMDEDIAKQKMTLEFLMYRELFKSWNLNSEVIDCQEFMLNANNQLVVKDTPYDFIYNRFCDFLLKEDSSKDLLCGFLEGAATLSPNPNEYILLADKNRMIDWRKIDYLNKFDLSNKEKEKIVNITLDSFKLSDKQSDTFWAERKKYFIKPLRSHGSKRTYNGKSISKKVYQELPKNDFLAQETCPPPIFTSSDNLNWKYDLRFFVYKNEIQLSVARLYQGQLTNFSTLGGGFATIDFK